MSREKIFLMDGSERLAKHDHILRGGALCGLQSRQPPYSSLRHSSPLLRSFERGQKGAHSASVQKPRATTCLSSTPRLLPVGAYKSSRG